MKLNKVHPDYQSSARWIPAQRLLDEGGPQPVAQWLLAPMLDDRTATREDLTTEQHFVWNNRNNWGDGNGTWGRIPVCPRPPPTP